MSRSGGNYTAPSSSWNPAVEGATVDETDWNALLDDIEAALTESVYTGGLGSTDNRLVRTDGTDTKKVQGTGITVDDSNNVIGVNNVSGVDAIFVTGTAGASGTLGAWNADGDLVEGAAITAAGEAMLEAANAAAQTALLDILVGDSGAGGTKGLVPAPAAGDAAANKFLKADGTWVAPAGSGDLLSTNNLSDVANAATARSNLGITSAGDDMVTAANVAAQTALLNAVVGDSGSGGTKGLVPAPAAGDAAASKFLKADGTWTTPSGAGDVAAASAFGTDNVLVRSDGTGKNIQSTGIAVDDSDNVTGVTSINGNALAGYRNVLINGGMQINKRAAATNADDTYAHDRWYILTQTDTVAVTNQTLIENGWTHAMRITQSQATAQRFGVAQIVESLNCRHLRGSAVTLSARVRCSASTTLRYAIIEWTGTADTVTSDFVNDWTSATFTAGNFFTSTSTTVTGTGSTALTANTAATVNLTATLGSSGNNVVVMFWTDSTQAQNVTFDIGKVQLEPGSKATPFERRPQATESMLCLRYYEKLSGASGDRYIRRGYGTETGAQYYPVQFFGEKRIAPTVALVSASSANASGASAFNPSIYEFEFYHSVSSSGGYTYFGYTADAEL